MGASVRQLGGVLCSFYSTVLDCVCKRVGTGRAVACVPDWADSTQQMWKLEIPLRYLSPFRKNIQLAIWNQLNVTQQWPYTSHRSLAPHISPNSLSKLKSIKKLESVSINLAPPPPTSRIIFWWSSHLNFDFLNKHGVAKKHNGSSTQSQATFASLRNILKYPCELFIWIPQKHAS